MSTQKISPLTNQNAQYNYEQLRSSLLAAVRSTCPAWLAHDAEDITQNALLKLHQKLQKSPDTELTKAYLRRVAHSVLVDEIRHRRRRFEGHKEDAMGDDFEVATQPFSTEQGTLSDALQDCLLRQQPHRRRALTLHLLGHTIAEVAEFLGSKPKQSENLVYRSLAGLRDCLIKKEVYP